MKEYLEIAAIAAVLVLGTSMAKQTHDRLREVALTKAAHGLPSLSDFTRSLQTRKYIEPAGPVTRPTEK